MLSSSGELLLLLKSFEQVIKIYAFNKKNSTYLRPQKCKVRVCQNLRFFERKSPLRARNRCVRAAPVPSPTARREEARAGEKLRKAYFELHAYLRIHASYS